jgi:hypothetical protein
MAASPDSRWWLLLARITIELLRRPATQVTVQRGLGGKRFQTIEEQRLITLRFVLDEDALDRCWPSKTQDEELQTSEALSVAMAEKAEALYAGRDELRLPPTQEEVEAAIEVAYRAYRDIASSGRQSEREAFGTAFRSLLAAAQARDLRNWSPPPEDREKLSRDTRELRRLCENLLRRGGDVDALAVASTLMEDMGVDVSSAEFWRRLGPGAPRVPAEISPDPYECTCLDELSPSCPVHNP